MGDAISCTFEQGRPEDTMVVDDIPANEMGYLRIATPVVFPVFTLFLRPFFGE